MSNFSFCALSPNGDSFVGISADYRISLWNVETGQIRTQIQASEPVVITALAVSDDKIAVGTDKGAVFLFSLLTGAEIDAFRNGHNAPVTGVAFPSSKILASCASDKSYAVWNLEKRKLKKNWKIAKGGSPSVIAALNNSLAIGSSSIRLVDLSNYKINGKLIGQATKVRSLQFSPDGNYLISTALNDRFVSVWDAKAAISAESSSPPSSSFINIAIEDFPIDARFTKDGKFFAALSSSLITLFDIADVTNSKTTIGSRDQIVHAFIFVGSDELVMCHGSSVSPVFKRVKFLSNDGKLQVSETDQEFSIDSESLGSDVDSAASGQKRKRDAEENVEYVGEMETNASALLKERASKLKKLSVTEITPAVDALGKLAAETSQIVSAEEENNSSTNVSEKSKDRPNASSLQRLLVQALHTNDKSSLEYVFSRVNSDLVANTVERLPSIHVLPMLEQLVSRLQQNSNRTSLLCWIKELLKRHAGYLISVPNLPKSVFHSLYQIVDTRVGTFDKFLALEGRLEMISAQIKIRQQRQQKFDAEDAQQFAPHVTVTDT